MATGAVWKTWFENGGREKMSAYNKKYADSYSGRYRIYIASAKGRGITFGLDLGEFSEIIAQPCFYCGETKERRGIDRIDNTLPYTKSNSTPCCKECNYMKKDMTVEQFISRVKKILTHQVSKI
jgi:hypothetical protein